MRILIAALALLAAPLTLSACDTFGAVRDPAAIGCTKAEANACRLVIAAHVLKSAAITVGEQLDRGLVTPAEAQRLLNIVKDGRDALAQARAALPLANGTTEERMAALELILTQLLAEQLIKAGA